MKVSQLVNAPTFGNGKVSKQENPNNQFLNAQNYNYISNPQMGAQPSAGLMNAYYNPNNVINVPEKPTVKSVWANSDPAKKQMITGMAENYKQFISAAKTDLTTVETMVQRAMMEGFQPWPQNQPGRALMPGEKFFRVNKDRAVQLIVIGQQPIDTGFKMVASHLDSPHITLKPKALQDAPGETAIFKTMIHGGIKKNQWTQRNLALVGKVIKDDGTEVKINIGNKPGEPVFVIPELAPHVDLDNKGKPSNEQMTPIVGSLSSGAENRISEEIEQILYSQYGITRENLVHAQLDLVPAVEPRDVGFDRGLISAYGSDDKSACFGAMEALISSTKHNPIPQKTMICASYGNEEISNLNAYGALSDDVRSMIGEIKQNTTGTVSEMDIRNAFKNSLIVSADVTTAIDPIKPGAEDSTNGSKLGYGPAISLDGKLNSTPEATALFSRLTNGVQTQTHTFNKNTGGGGTFGPLLATKHNTDVIEYGIPVLGMHSPNEIISKADLYEFTSGLMSYYMN